MTFASLPLILVLLLLGTAATAVGLGAGRIIAYNMTPIPSGTGGPDWAAYSLDSHATWVRAANASYHDDSQDPDPIGYCAPFFGPHAKVPLYADSNGFVSTQSFPLCTSYCSQASGGATYNAPWRWRRRGRDGGGDLLFLTHCDDKRTRT